MSTPSPRPPINLAPIEALLKGPVGRLHAGNDESTGTDALIIPVDMLTAAIEEVRASASAAAVPLAESVRALADLVEERLSRPGWYDGNTAEDIARAKVRDLRALLAAAAVFPSSPPAFTEPEASTRCADNLLDSKVMKRRPASPWVPVDPEPGDPDA